ncbi:MAG TPA: UDP-N-acetylmuramoyl-L-alanyl-D-glutamate--2,6-diaminopimelate ligase, partial [Parvularculaceae bacterium]|nr:UDP-N-acetylmuramoyl-L-alanyl-D-glutamate--2,6-diaminopimelate ligase [Parvularculaceae bacterium]
MKLSLLAGAPMRSDPDIVGLTADSRAVKPGYLFAALPGARADGAAFISQAEENGAAAILAAPGIKARAPVIADANPRRRLALMAAKFYGAQPRIVAGVTGTNGKTSTVRFAAQLWRLLGEKAGSLGTLGAEAPGFSEKLQHTTPDPVALHEMLARMAGAGVDHLAMEVSSHGLAQYRADGVRFAAAAFTNVTQDHLDYHADFEDYLAAKLRLFTELLSPGGVAVVNADGEGAERVIDAATQAGATILTTGAAGRQIRLAQVTPHAAGLAIEAQAQGKTYAIDLPLVGAFQAENALLAAGLVIGLGAEAARVLPLLERLEGAPGRMQRVAEAGDGVYVDYAHTPDAVATALAAIRPHVRGKLIAIIGAGGDRDRKKRPLMGEAAVKGAEKVIVTDDNPRSEDPAVIRREILAGAPGAVEIGDRAEAIETGVGMLGPGDVLLICGK